MKKLLYILLLILASLIQISWAPFLTFRGFVLPLVLLLLFFGSLSWRVTEVLFFAFAVGIFLNLLGGGLVGSQSLSLVLALTLADFVRNFLLGRKLLGFLAAAASAVVFYEIWLFFF